jgi:hypothetical protein
LPLAALVDLSVAVGGTLYISIMQRIKRELKFFSEEKTPGPETRERSQQEQTRIYQ